MKTLSYDRDQAREIIIQDLIDDWFLSEVIIAEDSTGEDVELITEDLWPLVTVAFLFNDIEGAEAREKRGMTNMKTLTYNFRRIVRISYNFPVLT